MILALTIVLVIVIDQLTKMMIAGNEAMWNIVLIKNFFHITYAKNTGMAWSLLSGQQFFLSLIAAVVIGVLLWYLLTQKADRITRFAVALMIGGAAGNLIDRLMLNYVRDFLDFYIFGYDFPIFNVADMALCIGVGLILLAAYVEDKKEKTNEA